MKARLSLREERGLAACDFTACSKEKPAIFLNTELCASKAHTPFSPLSCTQILAAEGTLKAAQQSPLVCKKKRRERGPQGCVIFPLERCFLHIVS
jgi:hypothetical protein